MSLLWSATGHRGSFRVSDAERERIAVFLREGCGEGRLTLDELEERVGRAYAASTVADLERLVGDLPNGARALEVHDPAPPRSVVRWRPALLLVLLLAGATYFAVTAPLLFGISLAVLALVALVAIQAAIAALPVLVLVAVVVLVARSLRRAPRLGAAWPGPNAEPTGLRLVGRR